LASLLRFNLFNLGSVLTVGLFADGRFLFMLTGNEFDLRNTLFRDGTGARTTKNWVTKFVGSGLRNSLHNISVSSGILEFLLLLQLLSGCESRNKRTDNHFRFGLFGLYFGRDGSVDKLLLLSFRHFRSLNFGRLTDKLFKDLLSFIRGIDVLVLTDDLLRSVSGATDLEHGVFRMSSIGFTFLA